MAVAGFVLKAVKHGRYALFHDCGLGKTIQQLEIARIICERENSKALILCPLAVSHLLSVKTNRL